MINISSSSPQPTVAPPPNMTPPPQATSQPSPDLATQSPQSPAPQENKNTRYFIIGGIILAILAIGGLASLFLVQEPQEIRQQAAQCVEQCPGNDGVLRNCTPPEDDGSAAESICNVKGRVEACGGKNYCCPAPGGTWTTNMTACATPTPEPSPTEEPGLCSSDSVADCRTADPGDYCNNGAGECTASGSKGADGKDVCTCADDPEPTATPTTMPTTVPTTAPTTAPTNAPTDAITTAPTTTAQATTVPTQPPLPSELPETGPEDWLKNLSIGLGALGVGALLFLFL